MEINVKTRIRINGHEYGSPGEMSPEDRTIYERATSLSGRPDHVVMEKRVVFNGREYAGADSMPAEVKRLCDDVMAIAGRNGSALPGFHAKLERRERLFSRQLVVLVFSIWILVLLGLFVWLRHFSGTR